MKLSCLDVKHGRTFWAAGLAACALVWTLCHPVPAEAFNLKFWKKQEAPEKSKGSSQARRGQRENRPEQLIERVKKKPATPADLGAGIQGVTVSLEYYRGELEHLRREEDRCRADLRAKEKRLRELKRQAETETREKSWRAMMREQDRLQEEIASLRRKRAGLSKEIKRIQGLVQGLEKELLEEKRRLHVLYWNYGYRLLLFLLIVGAAYLLNRFIRALIHRSAMEADRKEFAHRTAKIILYAATGICVIAVFLENLAYVAAVLGIASAGLAIALQDVFTSIVGWLILVTHRHVKVGDWIEVAGVRGRVLEISMLKMSLLDFGEDQETGRIIFLANNAIFKHPVYNDSYGHVYVWDKIDVLITFESDWHRAYTVFSTLLEEQTRETFREAARRMGAVAPPRLRQEFQDPEPRVVTSIEASGVNLSLRYLYRVGDLFRARNALNQAILEAVAAEPAIEFAYPTYRILNG